MNLDRRFDLPYNSEFDYGKLNVQNPNSNLSEYNQYFTDKGNLHDSLGLPMHIKQLRKPTSEISRKSSKISFFCFCHNK